MEEIERKQVEIKHKEDLARKYFTEKEKLWNHRISLRELNLAKNKNDKNGGKQNKNLETK